MKNLSSWLITIFIIMFWAFRVLVAVMGQMDAEFMLRPMDITTEIILLFVVLALVPFIFKRKIWAGIAYLVVYGGYFGSNLLTNVMAMINKETLSSTTYLEMLISLVAVTLGVVVVFDILFDKARMKNPVDKNTDWFYKNKEYDRQLDDRADKNNYRTL